MKKIKKVRKVSKVRKIKKIRKKRVFDIKKIYSSKIESFFGIFLEKELKLEIEKQFRIGYKFYDFKIKGENILIEFDGDFWHANPDKFPNGPESKMQAMNMKNDIYKDKLAKSNGYKLIRIWENDFRTNSKEVKKKLLNEINK